LGQELVEIEARAAYDGSCSAADAEDLTGMKHQRVSDLGSGCATSGNIAIVCNFPVVASGAARPVIFGSRLFAREFYCRGAIWGLAAR
jgi:hypothetical protein